MFQMLGTFADEFERALIQERVCAGMARARAKGTKSGKPIGRPAIHPARRAAIRAAYEAGGVGLRAAQFGVGVETVRRCVG
jgi:DNA invertase Pin-like site-specific DNA recombinase